MINMLRHAVMVFLLIVLFTLPAHADVSDQLINSLHQCSKALVLADHTLLAINVSDLAIDYHHGTLIEKKRVRALKYIQFSRNIIKSIENKLNIKDVINLVITLHNLESVIDSISESLIWYSTNELNLSNSVKWIKALEETCNDINNSTLSYEDAANEYADKIDSILQSILVK
ncbi:MAG: hypothetical protein HXX11_15160 [Desulfuromonadales bacterium]|nr:hypothetical protein [Desulfuromonadales bacterium]